MSSLYSRIAGNRNRETILYIIMLGDTYNISERDIYTRPLGDTTFGNPVAQTLVICMSVRRLPFGDSKWATKFVCLLFILFYHVDLLFHIPFSILYIINDEGDIFTHTYSGYNDVA